MRHSFATFACFFFCLVGTAFSIDAPRVVAHRGLLKHAPENTLANFRSCLTLRVGFEVDVQRAQDGTLVCIHDDTVDRTTDGRGRVAELSLRQLKELDAGSWFGTDFKSEPIPTFSEVAQLITASRPPSLIAVDLEAPGIEEDVVAEARQAGVLDRLLFIGSAIRDGAVRGSLRDADSSVHVACLANDPAQLDGALNDENSDWVYFRYLPSRAETAKVRAAGKQSFIAGPTVAGQEPVNWRRAVYSQLDAVLTDYPLELTSLHREVHKKASQHVTNANVERVAKPLTHADPEIVEIHGKRLQDAVSLIRRSVENDELRGAVLLVARRGKIVLHEAIGFRDSERTVPMKKNSLFRMASNSKAITAAGILALVQDGLVELDHPVSRYMEIGV
ncbi:MAG: glycerophosphodiester phosphodiesterase family protein [Planctomycetales bacterium]